MYKKIRLNQTTHRMHKIKSRILNCVIFVLILLLTIATMIAIQIRSESRKNQALSTASEDVDIYENIQNEETTAEYTEEIPETNAVSKTEEYIFPNNGEIIKPFSDTQLIYSSTMDDWRIHCGIDISVEQSSNVNAVYYGRVSDILTDDIYGTTIIIEHPDGMVSKYSNIQPSQGLLINSEVNGGDHIGDVLDNPLCEEADKPHLHFEIYKQGMPIDPATMLNY